MRTESPRPKAKARGKGKPFQKGDPRAGRPKGRKNNATLEVKELARRMVENEAYQRRLQARMVKGKIPPAVETMLWYYAYGKPRERVEVTGEGGAPVAFTLKLDDVDRA